MTKRRSRIFTDYFITNFTPESSYILGLLWADGYVSASTNEIRISALKTDVEIYLPTFQKTGRWLDYWSDLTYPTRNNKPQGTLVCSSLKLKEFLAEHSYKPHNVSTTNIVSLIPKSLQHYWYRGYIDGDGCWTYGQTSRILPSGNINRFTNRKFTITGPLHQDWTFFTHLLESLNVNYKINRYNKTNKYSHLTVTGKENYLKLGNYTYQGYPDDQIGLPRKYQKYQEIMQSYK